MPEYHVATYWPDRTLRVYPETFELEIADEIVRRLGHSHAPTSFVVVPASAPGQLRPFAAGKMGPAYARAAAERRAI